MKHYFGQWTRDHGAIVGVIHDESDRAYRLPPRCDLYNHSPTGFAWGYGGSGPAQLALAILADYLEDDAKALRLYQAFKWEVITRLPAGSEWELTGADIELALVGIDIGTETEAGSNGQREN
jgi:hypothetical protein